MELQHRPCENRRVFFRKVLCQIDHNTGRTVELLERSLEQCELDRREWRERFAAMDMRFDETRSSLRVLNATGRDSGRAIRRRQAA